jgi:dipeptidyl-peptidase-4
VLALDGRRTEIPWDKAAYKYLVTAAWDVHGISLTVQSRDQRTLRELTGDPERGTTALAHERLDDAWVELVDGTPTRTASGVPVRVQERDDTRQLTIGDACTPPGVQLRAVVGVDGERVLFTASEEPTAVHVWSYQPDRGFERISEEPGVHTAAAGAGTVVLDSRTMDGHAVAVLRDGKPIIRITSHTELPLPEPRVTWKSTGEREIRTALVLPSWHEPGSRKLPTLLAPYAGQGLQLVTRARHWWLSQAQWFADSGFAVLIADGRGTPGRGPAWEKSWLGDRLTAAIDDQVAALHGVAEHFPDLDLGRVGIFGWSYGGYLAAGAVLRRPDVFHAAVAGAAPFDQRLYDTHWMERFLGHPDEHPEAYDRSSLLDDAPNLRRPLLLVHGLGDDNVLAAHTLRMSQALLAAGRRHSVLPLPDATHAVTQPDVAESLLCYERDFLRDALKTPDPLAG